MSKRSLPATVSDQIEMVGELFKCPKCSKTLKHKGSIERHIIKEHPEMLGIVTMSFIREELMDNLRKLAIFVHMNDPQALSQEDIKRIQNVKSETELLLHTLMRSQAARLITLEDTITGIDSALTDRFKRAALTSMDDDKLLELQKHYSDQIDAQSKRMANMKKQIEEETENILEYIGNIFEEALPQSVTKTDGKTESIPLRVCDQAAIFRRLEKAKKGRVVEAAATNA